MYKDKKRSSECLLMGFYALFCTAIMEAFEMVETIKFQELRTYPCYFTRVIALTPYSAT